MRINITFNRAYLSKKTVSTFFIPQKCTKCGHYIFMETAYKDRIKMRSGAVLPKRITCTSCRNINNMYSAF